MPLFPFLDHLRRPPGPVCNPEILRASDELAGRLERLVSRLASAVRRLETVSDFRTDDDPEGDR